MLEWQSIEFRILKLKLHSCTTYRVVDAGLGGRHGYRLLYAFQGIGPNGRGTFSLGSSWELWRHPDSIPVCLSTIRHKSLKLGLRNTVPCHDIIQVLPEYHLSSSIL
jgi:hypothetical protein